MVSSPSQCKTIICGVQGTPADESLVHYGASLAKALCARLHLIHCHEPQTGYWFPPIAGAEVLEVISEMSKNSESAMQSHLEHLIERFATKASYELLQGPPATQLVEKAKEKEACMILVGAREGDHRFIPPVFSVPLSLFNQSPIPVMVVREGTTSFWRDEGLKVLVADDLTPGGEKAVAFAESLLSKASAPSQLELLHVNPLTEELFLSGLNSALASARQSPLQGLDAKAALQAMHQEFEKALSKRLHGGDLKAKIHIRSGKVEEELSMVADQLGVDLIVFGRHKGLHRNPFYFGRVPFASAFRLGIPFAVVP